MLVTLEVLGDSAGRAASDARSTTKTQSAIHVSTYYPIPMLSHLYVGTYSSTIATATAPFGVYIHRRGSRAYASLIQVSRNPSCCGQPAEDMILWRLSAIRW